MIPFITGSILIKPLSQAADVSCVVTFDASELMSEEHLAEHLEQLVAISLKAVDGKDGKWVRPWSEEFHVTKDSPHIGTHYKGLKSGAYLMSVSDLGAGATAVYLQQTIQVHEQAEPQVFNAYLPARTSWFKLKFDAAALSDLEPQDTNLKIHFQRVSESKDDTFKNDYIYPLLNLKPDKEELRGLAMAHDGSYRVTIEGVPESWVPEQKVHIVKGKFVPEIINFVKGKTWNGPAHRRAASQE